MRKLFGVALVIALAVTACASPAAAPPAPTPAPPPMAKKLVVYGDTVLFAGKDNPDTCILKSRYKPGEAVGFRMTALDGLTGKVDDGAELVVKLSTGDTVSMRYRGTGDNPHPGVWTGKWVVPADAKTGVIRYTVEAKDKDGRSGTYQPFDIEPSLLTIASAS